MVVSAKPLVTPMSTLVTVHVSSFEDRIPCGEVYNGYYDKSIPFRNDRELLGVLEELFDTLSFPCRFDNYRCFYDKKRPSPVKKGKRCGNMSEKNKATFIIHVQFRRNATWQGTIQWVESQKQQSFRSTLEMLRLIDEALEDGSEPTIQWE